MLQKQVAGLEKQRDYLMKKVQAKKGTAETEKFDLVKTFELEKLDMHKKMEELLTLNDVLAGQKRIVDTAGNKIDTSELMSILNPSIDEDDPSN